MPGQAPPGPSQRGVLPATACGRAAAVPVCLQCATAGARVRPLLRLVASDTATTAASTPAHPSALRGARGCLPPGALLHRPKRRQGHQRHPQPWSTPRRCQCSRSRTFSTTAASMVSPSGKPARTSGLANPLESPRLQAPRDKLLGVSRPLPPRGSPGQTAHRPDSRRLRRGPPRGFWRPPCGVD